jgi:hypothetical protein
MTNHELSLLARKVAMVHGGSHPDMAALSPLVDDLADGKPADWPRIRSLCQDFRPWPGACGSVWALMTGLAALEPGRTAATMPA